MEIKQVYQFVNDAVGEVIGDTALVAEDLSNVVDVGTAIFNASAFDAYVKSLVNHIGKVIFVNRPYRGAAPSVLMDAWEYGSVVEKIHSEMPEAVENESWDLVDGQSYDPHVFHQPVVEAKFFNKTNSKINLFNMVYEVIYVSNIPRYVFDFLTHCVILSLEVFSCLGVRV